MTANLSVHAGAWSVCVPSSSGNADPNVHIACTADYGASWTVLPDLTLNGSSLSQQLMGIVSDGSVVLTTTSTSIQLYRLPAGATRWQALGSLPPTAAYATYVPTPSGGILWAFPAESDGAAVPGAPNDVYSATYPAG
jgi:hypothetical protein